MQGLTPDEIIALAESKYDIDVYDTRDQKLFAMLVNVAAETYKSYVEANGTPDLDNPDSFKPKTLGGVETGWALIQGLIENLEMEFPEANFREMFPGRKA